MPIPTSGAIWCPTGLVDRRGILQIAMTWLATWCSIQIEKMMTGWWFGTCFFSIIYGIILPIDFHILSYFSRWLKHVKTTNQWWSTTEFSKILWLQSPKITLRWNRSQVTYTRRKQTSECFNGEKFERPVSRKVPGMCFQMGKVGDRKERLDVFSYFTYLLVLTSVISKISIHIIY